MGYFRELPEIDYQSFLSDSNSSQNYLRVKNLFRRNKLRDDLQNVFTVFEKYEIVDGARPDTVAEEFYGDSELDWVVLMTANITRVRDQWPLSNRDLYKYAENKYGVTGLTSVHHYETKQITDSEGRIIIRAGSEVPSDYSISYYDSGEQITATDTTVAVTNYEYETDIQDELRNIYLVKPEYLNLVIQDIERLMPVKPGSTQYVSDDLSQGDNIRLYS